MEIQQHAFKWHVGWGITWEELKNTFNWMTTQHELKFGNESKATLNGNFIVLNIYIIKEKMNNLKII